MIRFRLAALSAAILTGIAVRGSSAQGPDTSSVDRIVAVVGSKAITLSRVQEELFGRVQNGTERLPNPKADSAGFERVMSVMVRRYTDTLVAFELLHRDAVLDTLVKVTEQEVNDAADALIADLHKRFKTIAEYKDQLKVIGFSTEEDYRKFLLENQRRTLTVRRYAALLREDGKIKEMTPTAKEVRAFYDAHIAEFGQAPATVSFKQIIIAPKPSDAAKARAKALADSLIIALRKDANFADVAKQYSMDEGSKADGGNLPWFTHGRMIREFEDAAFALKPGTISEPVESPYGYHIIQVQRVQPGEVQARHILIIPDVDSASAQAAEQRARDIVAAVQKGASFDSLQHLYHDRAEELEVNGFPLDSIVHTPYGVPLTDVDSGKVAQPFTLPVANHPLHTKWAVVQVTRRTAAGPPAFDDLKALIKRNLAIMLGEQDYITQLRARTFVDIRSP